MLTQFSSSCSGAGRPLDTIKLFSFSPVSSLCAELSCCWCSTEARRTEEVVWLGHHVAMPRPATHFIYIIICFRYSVNATCKLWFVLLYMQHLLHVCLSWERDLSSAVLPEVSSTPCVKILSFFFPSTWQVLLPSIKGLRTEDVVHCKDCKAHWGDVIVI